MRHGHVGGQEGVVEGPTSGSPPSPSPSQSKSPVQSSTHRIVHFHAVELRSCSIRLQRLHNGLFIEWRPGVSTFLIAPGQSTLDTTLLLSVAAHQDLGREAQDPHQKSYQTLDTQSHRLLTRLLLLFGCPGAAALLEAFLQISPAGILIDLDERRNDGATPDYTRPPG